jgi:hypothetical protein
MGTGGNFEDKLQLVKDPDTGDIHVEAKGPVDGDVVELCVWIIQRQGESDAAATQITTYPGRGKLKIEKDPVTNKKTWELRALKASTRPLKPGFATAMAIALFLEENGEEQAYQWAQSVELV